jgi:predicted alpha/beta-fold hydrolase
MNIASCGGGAVRATALCCMPIIHGSTYRAPFLFSNGHLQTLYPSLARKLGEGRYQRERIETPDRDFLDLDWSRAGNRKLAILSHGLEGNTHRPYMVGMVRMLNQHGKDVLAWNYRACSGEINRRLSTDSRTLRTTDSSAAAAGSFHRSPSRR